MKLSINKDKLIQLEEVFNPIVFKSSAGEKLSLCMRDTGYELQYEGQNIALKEGMIATDGKAHMRLKEFIETFSHNNIVRLLYAIPGGHELVHETWDDVSMDHEILRGRGKNRHYLYNRVVGLASIYVDGNNRDAINIVIEKMENQMQIPEATDNREKCGMSTTPGDYNVVRKDEKGNMHHSFRHTCDVEECKCEDEIYDNMAEKSLAEKNIHDPYPISVSTRDLSSLKNKLEAKDIHIMQIDFDVYYFPKYTIFGNDITDRHLRICFNTGKDTFICSSFNKKKEIRFVPDGRFDKKELSLIYDHIVCLNSNKEKGYSSGVYKIHHIIKGYNDLKVTIQDIVTDQIYDIDIKDLLYDFCALVPGLSVINYGVILNFKDISEKLDSPEINPENFIPRNDAFLNSVEEQNKTFAYWDHILKFNSENIFNEYMDSRTEKHVKLGDQYIGDVTTQGAEKVKTFEAELNDIIKKYGYQGETNTPCFVLANMLVRCLKLYNIIMTGKEKEIIPAEITEFYDIYQFRKPFEDAIKERYYHHSTIDKYTNYGKKSVRFKYVTINRDYYGLKKDEICLAEVFDNKIMITNQEGVSIEIGREKVFADLYSTIVENPVHKKLEIVDHTKDIYFNICSTYKQYVRKYGTLDIVIVTDKIEQRIYRDALNIILVINRIPEQFK